MPTVPPIGLKSIEITNFRRIDSLHLDFTGAGDGPSDIVVIGGPNGCGKTTVLEACLLAIGYKGEFRGATGKAAARTGHSDWSIRAEIDTPQGQYTTLAQPTQPKGETAWIDITTGHATKSVNVPCLYVTSWRAPVLIGVLSITAGKRGKRPADTEPNRIWRAKQRLIDSRAYKLMSVGQQNVDGFDKELEQLNRVWTTFHPRADEHFEVGPVGADPSEGFDVFLASRDGRKVPVDALSSGQLELFALFGALMLVKFRDGIVVIDEPELHLDPQWHALMVRAIREFLPTAQLIVATHSPKVYDSVMSFQRHFLVPETDPRAVAWKAPQPASAAV